MRRLATRSPATWSVIQASEGSEVIEVNKRRARRAQSLCLCISRATRSASSTSSVDSAVRTATDPDRTENAETDESSIRLRTRLLFIGGLAIAILLLWLVLNSSISRSALSLLACALIIGGPLIVIGGLLFHRGVIFFRLGEWLGIEHSERRSDPRRRACPSCGERRFDDRLRCRACGEDVFRRIHDALTERPAANAAPMADCPWCAKPMPTDRAWSCIRCGAGWKDSADLRLPRVLRGAG